MDPKEQSRKDREERLRHLHKAVEDLIDRHPYTPCAILRASLPDPGKMRALASYVDVGRLREIDDAEEIEKMFDELKFELQKWADALEKYDTKRKSPD